MINNDETVKKIIDVLIQKLDQQLQETVEILSLNHLKMEL